MHDSKGIQNFERNVIPNGSEMNRGRVLTDQGQWNLVAIVTIFSSDDAFGLCLTSVRTIANARTIQPFLERNRINQNQVLLVLLAISLLLHGSEWMKMEWHELNPMELAEEWWRMLHLLSSLLTRCGFLPLHPNGSLHVVGDEGVFMLPNEAGPNGSAVREEANLPPGGKETQHPSSERASTVRTDGYGTNGPSHQQPVTSQAVPGQQLAPDVALMDFIVDTALAWKDSKINLDQLTNFLAFIDYQFGNKYREQVMRLYAPNFKKEPELPQGQSVVINHIGTQIGTVSSGAVGAVNMDKE